MSISSSTLKRKPINGLHAALIFIMRWKMLNEKHDGTHNQRKEMNMGKETTEINKWGHLKDYIELEAMCFMILKRLLNVNFSSFARAVRRSLSECVYLSIYLQMFACKTSFVQIHLTKQTIIPSVCFGSYSNKIWIVLAYLSSGFALEFLHEVIFWSVHPYAQMDDNSGDLSSRSSWYFVQMSLWPPNSNQLIRASRHFLIWDILRRTSILYH